MVDGHRVLEWLDFKTSWKGCIEEAYNCKRRTPGGPGRKFDSPPSAKEAGGAGTSRAQTPEWRVDRWRGRRKQPVSEACGYSHRLFRATITHLISAEHGGHWLAMGHSVPQAVAVKISRQTRVLAIWGIDIEGKALLGH